MKRLWINWFVLTILLSACSSAVKIERSPALYGGSLAKTGEFPATVQINDGPDADGRVTTRCTGILISRTHILTAAHCLLRYTDGVQPVFDVDFPLAVGINAQYWARREIKALYVPKEAVAFLKENKTWNIRGAERAHDVAVVEFKSPLPERVEKAGETLEEIKIGKMSERKLAVGDSILYGGYGCEELSQITGEAHELNYHPHLKYAKGSVTEVTDLTAQGPIYEGTPTQSSCPGDSGGPIFMNDNNASHTEYVGIVNFTKHKYQGDNYNSEVGFSILNSHSVLGQWVKDVLAGRIQPL